MFNRAQGQGGVRRPTQRLRPRGRFEITSSCFDVIAPVYLSDTFSILRFLRRPSVPPGMKYKFTIIANDICVVFG